MTAEVSKVLGHAVVGTPEETAYVTKVMAYAAVGTPEETAFVTKVMAYAVVGPFPVQRPILILTN